MAYFYFKNNYLQKACNTESDKNKLAPQKEANGWIEKDVSEDMSLEPLTDYSNGYSN